MDGEGVVAIVQGLHDAGLAVTVLNTRLLRTRNSHRRPLASKSSVETNTDKSYNDYYKTNRCTSVRDGHYSSIYQIAHCNATPTSPPQSSLEFPPQRLKPSRTEGNFEVGASYGVWDTSTSPSQGHGSHIGCFDRSVDTGSMYMNHRDRKSHETFAHSLRRYPYSPERSISSELVQKLLNYTQNKYLTKSTSKSQRSLNRDRSPLSSRFDVKQSKNIQTYTRTKREHRTRDCGANTSHDLKFMTNRQGRSHSTMKGNRDMDENNNTSYDYLDSPPTSRHSPYRSEVRYIRDVKKYIRDTISQIYDDKQMVCPKIKSRYSHHRRLHHKDQPSSRSTEVQASVPTTSKLACTHFCHPPPGSHSYSHNIANVNTSDIMCCTCKKLRPCVCQLKAEKMVAGVQQHIEDWVDELPIYTEDTEANKREKEKITKELLDFITKVPKDENYNEVIKEEITKFIERLPIWEAVDEEDSEGRKNGIIDSLLDRLQTGEDQILAAVKDIVRKWLDGIPLDENMNMDKTTQNFASQLTPKLKDVGQLKTKLKDLLNDLPITNKDDVINEIHGDFTNDLFELSARSDQPVLTEQEMENEINEYLESYRYKIIDQGDKVKNLARKLKNMQSKPISESEKEEKMKENVINWIDTLPKSTKDKFSPKEKEEFSNYLVDKVQDAKNLKARAKGKQPSLQTENEIENEIWDLLESMDVDPNDFEESIVKGFALNLKEMNRSDFDEENVANTTKDFLKELDKSGVGMRSRDKDKFYDKVAEKLKKIKAKNRQNGGGRHSSFVTSTPKKGGARPKKDFNVSSIGDGDESRYSIAGPSGLKNAEKQYNNELNDQIESWVDNLPINLQRETKLKKTLIDDLANDIMDRQKYLQIHPKAAKSDAEELEHLKYQVFRWLNKMEKVKDYEIAPVMDKTENLMDKIKNVDVPQFNKSSLVSSSKEKSSGLPNRENRINSPTRQQGIMSPGAEKIYGSLTREESLGSQTGKKNFESPTKEKISGSPTREKSILSPGKQKSYGSTSREISLTSPSTEKTFGSPSGEKKIGSPREQSLISETKEKRRVPNREQNFMSVHSEESARSPAKEKGLGSPTKDQTLDNKTYIPTQDASMFIKENLDGAISDWIKQLPLYSKASPEHKRKFDNLISEISNGIKEVYDGIDNLKQDIDKLVEDEIEKQMKKFPISSEDKEDKKFMNQAAAQLLQNLKDQQMFQDISERTDVPYDGYLNKHVDDWVNSLSLTRLSSPEKIELEDLKNEFTTKLKKAREDKVDDDTLKSEITKYLKKLPFNDTLKRNKEYQDRKVEELLKGLSTLPLPTASRKILDIHPVVRQAVTKWMQKLPLDRGKTVNDIPKDTVENTVNKISDGLINSEEIPVKQVKKTVEDATVRFLDQTPLDPKKTHDKKALADDLFERVKDIPKSVMKRTPSTPTSYGAGSSKEYSRDDEPMSINELKEIVGDNLTGAILDFMKQQPDYLDKKDEYNKLASNLAETVKTTLKKSKGEDQDKVLIEAITKQFKNTPLESKNGENEAQLVQYLKDLQMLQRNSSTTTIDIEDLNDIVNNFANNNLNLKKVTWSEKKKFGELKSELSAKLKGMINDKADRDALKKEIKYYLKKFPISEDDQRDDSYLDKKAEELIDSLPMYGGHNSPDVYNYVRKGFMKWMKNLPLEKGKNINDIPKQTVGQLARRLSELFIHTDVIGISDLKKKLEEETTKFLQISPLDKNISCDSKKFAKDLFDCIKGSSKTSSNDKTTEGSTPKSSYMDKTVDVSVPGSTGVSASELRSIRVSVSEPRSTRVSVSEPRSTRVSASEPRSSSKEMTTEASTSKSSHKNNQSGSMYPSFKTAADQFSENIEQWVNNLPIKEDTPEEKSNASDMRRHLSSKIISKVSELNTNPEIFNDDYLYAEMFEDELDKIITSLSNEDLQSNISAHKKSLIDIVKNGRLKTQEEMAGTVYKQQLRDVVSKNVPSKSLNSNENASFEVLKDDVADAFVSLHYTRGEKGDGESKAQFKNNVKSEVDKFCAEYLKHHPKTAAAVDVEKRNSDLYKALKDVPVPNDETMKHEIDIIKIKELINQWIDETKILGNQTGADRLKTKKKISVLAKKVHEIEKLKENNPDFDSNDMLKKEIVKCLLKMPLVAKNDLDELAEQLIMKLKQTEDLRKSLRSDSSGKESTLPASSYSTGPWSSTMDSTGRSSGGRFSSTSKSGASSKSLRRSGDISTVPEGSEPKTETADKSTGPEYTIVPSPCAPPCAIPPSSLSPEDKEYLKKIRERATQSKKQSSPRTSKDAAVSPIPVDYGSQTEITTDMTTSTLQAESTLIQAQPSSEISESVKPSKPEMLATGSQVEVVPNVIVKEYYWDSINSKMSPCPNLTCPFAPQQIPEMTCSSRPSNPCPYRTSQHAQTAPTSAQDCNTDCPYFTSDIPEPCLSKSRRSSKSCHNAGPKIRDSNRNLAWSKEELYGERRTPSDEEEIIIDTGKRRKVTCRCKDRVKVTRTTKRECRICRNVDDSLKRCPKCCGVHCPYPSYFYFNKQ